MSKKEGKGEGQQEERGEEEGEQKGEGREGYTLSVFSRAGLTSSFLCPSCHNLEVINRSSLLTTPDWNESFRATPISGSF